MSFVPSSVKLPPQLRDVSNSVLGRRQATIYPATGSIPYSASNRLITFNISSEPALLDTDKLYFEFDAIITKVASTIVVPNNSAESYIDRLVLRVGSKVIVDTGYGYQTAESMMHHWQSLDFSASSGGIMGISSYDIAGGLSQATLGTPANGDITARGNNTFVSRCQRYGFNSAQPTRTLLLEEAYAGTATARFTVPLRLCGFLDGITNLIPLWVLDSTISLSLDIYLSANIQVMSTNTSLAVAGTPASATYTLQNCLLSADYIDVSDDYKNTINSYIGNGGIYSIPSSEFNIYQFAVSASTDVSFQLSAVYKDLEAIYLGFFSSTSDGVNNRTDQLLYPNLGSVQLQIGSKYYPSDQPLDCTGRAVRAFQQTAKAFHPDGIEAGFSVPADAYTGGSILYQSQANSTGYLSRFETQTFFVVGFGFQSLLDEDENTITGLDTSQGQGVCTIRLKGIGANNLTACNMVVLCKYKQQVMVGQNYTVDRML